MEQKSSILGHYNSRIMLLRSINSLSKLDVFSRVDSRELSCHKNIAMQTKNWKEKKNYNHRRINRNKDRHAKTLTNRNRWETQAKKWQQFPENGTYLVYKTKIIISLTKAYLILDLLILWKCICKCICKCLVKWAV